MKGTQPAMAPDWMNDRYSFITERTQESGPEASIAPAVLLSTALVTFLLVVMKYLITTTNNNQIKGLYVRMDHHIGKQVHEDVSHTSRTVLKQRQIDGCSCSA